jgi:tripartite-type tricarboxylate transporter receptor subunit TctC
MPSRTMPRQTMPSRIVRSQAVSSLVSKLAGAAMLGLAGLAAAAAQTYPSRPITMVVPFAAGGPTDVPTALEQGVSGVDAYTWNAIFLPKNAPEAIVTKLNDAAWTAMRTPLVKERLQGLGAQIVADDRATPEYLRKFVKSETEKWAGPIKASGAVVD